MFFLVLFGLLLPLTPRTVIELNKRAELIGFRNTRDVALSDWYVPLHRAGGLLVVFAVAVGVGASAYLP